MYKPFLYDLRINSYEFYRLPVIYRTAEPEGDGYGFGALEGGGGTTDSVSGFVALF